MELRKPLLIINFKNYPEIFGDNCLRLAKAAEKVAEELGLEVCVCPPSPYLSRIAPEVSIPVLAQHLDFKEAGSTTGHIVAEALREIGVQGSLVNHSERRITRDDVERVVERLKSFSMNSVVCAATPEEVSDYSHIYPTFLAIEPPELIGTGRAVSRVKPEFVSESVSWAKKANPRAQVICGAGIVTSEDVKAAIGLGTVGVLVASAVVKARDWFEKVMELAKPLAHQ